MTTDISIVILTFNGQKYLEQLLHAIFGQKLDKSYEIIVIDSGSTDNTLQILSKYPQVRLHTIVKKEFGHGKTRNLAINCAVGEFVVFLTQDAVPCNEKWLKNLILPFEINEKVACVLGKQIAWPDCNVGAKREVTEVFRSFGPDDLFIITGMAGEKNRKPDPAAVFFSDVNSAVRKTIISAYPFRDVDYAEDQCLATDLLQKGYYKAFSSNASVYHSHSLSLIKYYRRKFNDTVGLIKNVGIPVNSKWTFLLFSLFKSCIKDFLFILSDKEYTTHQKIRNIIFSPLYNIAVCIAFKNANKLCREKSQVL